MKYEDIPGAMREGFERGYTPNEHAGHLAKEAYRVWRAAVIEGMAIRLSPEPTAAATPPRRRYLPHAFTEDPKETVRDIEDPCVVCGKPVYDRLHDTRGPSIDLSEFTVNPPAAPPSSDAPPGTVRVLRLIEYVGPREWVEKTLAKSLPAEVRLTPEKVIRTWLVTPLPSPEFRTEEGKT